MRREAVAWLSDQHVGPVDDAALVIAELLANGIRAARRTVLLDVSVTDGQVRVSVTDDGPGFAQRPRSTLPPAEAEGSRGLFLVRALSSDFLVDRDVRGTTVCCCVLLHQVAEPA